LKQALKAKITEFKTVCRNEAELSDFKALSETLQRVEKLEKDLKAAKKAENSKRTEMGKLLTSCRNVFKLAEAQELILIKLRDLVTNESAHYFNIQLRKTSLIYETIYDKYLFSLRHIYQDREKQQTKLDNFLKELGYE